MGKLNVLITSISKKVPLINAVREACQRSFKSFQIFGSDSSPNVLGRYFVDHFWQMPSLSELAIDQLVDFCYINDIKAIIPTRDGELIFFAKNKERLIEHGIQVMVSRLSSVEACLDKLLFYKQAERHGLSVIPTYLDVDEISAQQLVVKERFGAGAGALGLNLNSHEATVQAAKLINPIYQPYINGEEYSIDMYVAQGGQLKGVIPRKRNLVVNGESQITTTVVNEQLIQLGKSFCTYYPLYGHVMLQVLLDVNGDAHIIECNPRFGGASTLSLAVGLDSFKWFLTESIGKKLTDIPFIRPQGEKKMIRYTQDRFLCLEE